MKKIQGVYSNPRSHWVGDGFPVRSLFSYDTLGRHVSPFLLLDYAGPAQFAPATKPRGDRRDRGQIRNTAFAGERSRPLPKHRRDRTLVAVPTRRA